MGAEAFSAASTAKARKAVIMGTQRGREKGWPLRYSRRGLQTAAAAGLALGGLLAPVGCASGAGCIGGGRTVLLERGHSAQRQPWQLAASEHCGQLRLTLQSPSGHGYSGAQGFSADPTAGFWMEGSGPGRSDFFYGPAPPAAVTVRLSAPGQATVLAATQPFPARAGLPRGRFFILQNPGPASVNWNVTLLDAAGHKVAFTNF